MIFILSENTYYADCKYIPVMCFLLRGMGWVFIIIFLMHPVYDMGGPDITSDGRVDRSRTPPEIITFFTVWARVGT